MRRSARTVKCVLFAVNGQTEATIQNSKVWVATHANPEIKAAVFGVRVIPVAIVVKTVTRGCVEDRLSRLVNRVVV